MLFIATIVSQDTQMSHFGGKANLMTLCSDARLWEDGKYAK